jgi:hypothetical protein
MSWGCDGMGITALALTYINCILILLIGGDKTGDRAFYVSMISTAEALYDQYLAELRSEGLIP